MEYEIKESERAKHLRVTVYPNGEVVITRPRRMSEAAARRFAESKRPWIEEVQTRFARTRARQKEPDIEIPKLRRGTKAYTEAIARARVLVAERLAHFAPRYGFRYKRVAIRNQKSRWGSCSVEGNLNFNYRLALIPPELVDYVVVHELCHLKEHNHSPRFWALVGQEIPDYRERRKQLRRIPLG